MSKPPRSGLRWTRLNPPHHFPLISDRGHVVRPTKLRVDGRSLSYEMQWPGLGVSLHWTLHEAKLVASRILFGEAR